MQEPAGDLAVAAALASSVYDKSLPARRRVRRRGRPRRRDSRRVAGGAPHRRGREDGDDGRVRRRAQRAEARAEVDPRGGRARHHGAAEGAVPVSARDVGVVIVAAGSRSRTGDGELKQFRWVAGKPMLLHSLQTFPGARRRGDGRLRAAARVRRRSAAVDLPERRRPPARVGGGPHPCRERAPRHGRPSAGVPHRAHARRGAPARRAGDDRPRRERSPQGTRRDRRAARRRHAQGSGRRRRDREDGRTRGDCGARRRRRDSRAT